MNRVRLDETAYNKRHDILAWCSQNFGPTYNETTGVRRWGYEIIFSAQHFSFRYEKDAVLFSLRWL